MRVLWAQLAATSLVVQIDYLLDGITDIVIVFRGVSNLHFALFKGNGVSWCTLCRCFTFASSRSSITSTCKNLSDVRFIFRDESGWPLTLCLQIVYQLKVVNASCLSCRLWCFINFHSLLILSRSSMLADNRSSLNEELLPFVPVARVDLI